MKVARTLSIGLFTLAALFVMPAVSFAATLDFSPASISVHAGDSFTATVLVSSPSETLNAAGSIISFPANLLSVDSINNTASVFTLWVEQPSFSNTLGTVSWSGIVPNPGYSGSDGRVLGVRFRAKSAGTATLAFTSSSVLANDGSGTNILTAATPATVSIAPAAAGGSSSAPSSALETPRPQVVFVQSLPQKLPSGIPAFWGVLPTWVQESILIAIGIATIIFAIALAGFGIVVLVWLLSHTWRALVASGHFFGMAERELEGDVGYSAHQLLGEVKEASYTPSFKTLIRKYLSLLRDIARRFTTRERPQINADTDIGIEQSPEEASDP